MKRWFQGDESERNEVILECKLCPPYKPAKWSGMLTNGRILEQPAVGHHTYSLRVLIAHYAHYHPSTMENFVSMHQFREQTITWLYDYYRFHGTEPFIVLGDVHRNVYTGAFGANITS
jgi:hypothetical protein